MESTEAGDSNSGTLLDSAALSDYLTHRFPNDKAASVKGMEFARELTEACGISSIEDLDQSLSAIQSDQVRLLMDTPTTVTQVRRLDDELLAVFGESYIKKKRRIIRKSRPTVTLALRPPPGQGRQI